MVLAVGLPAALWVLVVVLKVAVSKVLAVELELWSELEPAYQQAVDVV